MSTEVYDVIVVGAGVEGSATAYQLAKRKQKTLLLEQFRLPHARGSSHGQTRITRTAYDTQFYIDMMPEAFDGIRVLEEETKQNLFSNVGFMKLELAGDKASTFALDHFKKNGLPYQYFTPEELNTAYPQFQCGPDIYGFLDPSGGILRADKILHAFWSVFVRNGGEILDGEEMVNIIPGDIVTVITNKGSHRARNVVLAMGPWAPKAFRLLGVHVPFKIKRILVLYWKERLRGEFGPDKTPAFSTGGGDLYGLPSDDYPGMVKLCLHDGPEIDPEEPGKAGDQQTISKMIDHVRDNFPGLEPKPSVIESCIYTCTEGTDPILDRHPVWRNVILAAGFSGHGFKLSPVVGSLLADLVMNKTPAHSMEPFKLKRFMKSRI